MFCGIHRDMGMREEGCGWCSVAVLRTRLGDWIWRWGGSGEGLCLTYLILLQDQIFGILRFANGWIPQQLSAIELKVRIEKLDIRSNRSDVDPPSAYSLPWELWPSGDVFWSWEKKQRVGVVWLEGRRSLGSTDERPKLDKQGCHR